jgi:TonB-dependent SusC/RagA subfamily outer membrane receptor
MKHLLIVILTLFVFQMNHAQNNNYSKLWKQVETFENEGLPKSALKLVESIEAQAKEKNNKAQLIKALLFKSKYVLVLEENAQLKVVSDFKEAITKSQSPEKNVLQNMLATLYWQYFQQNRWKFYNRTKTSEKVDDIDFRTWDLETLFEEIHSNFQASLKNGLILQQTPIRDFEVLLNTQTDSEIYRPSVFDLLAHNALAFYKTNENRITQPAETFSIQDKKFISTASEFSYLELKSPDSLALQFQALHIYQDLIQYHLKKQKSLALAQINIERLNFVKQNISLTNAQNLFLDTYKKEAELIKENKAEALYNYEIASIFYQKGLEFSSENKENQWKLKDALDLCIQTSNQYPKSLGAEKCNTLIIAIRKPQLQITSESFLRPNQNEKILITHKNIDVVNFESYQLNKKQYDAYKKIYREDAKKTFIEQLNAANSWTANLTNEGDYQTHRSELILPKLENGLYLIVANTKDIWASSTLQVSNYAMVESEDNNQKHLQFIDRASGTPIANANVSIEFSYQNKVIQTQKLITDKNGKVSFKKAAHNRSTFEAVLNYKNETAYFGNSHIYFYDRAQNENKTVYQSFIFTDRSIYRPGQTVYYKAIALKTLELKSEVIPNEILNIRLFNANDEEVSKHRLKTNEYGSVSGEFILPNTGLNGEYYLEIESENNLNLDSEYYFSVEEYKRPKFETTFQPVTDTYKVNDSITVKGNANAFSGSTITNAKVVYKVKREVNYPSWYRWSRPYYNSQAQEITFGEALTNNKGEFEIKFKAIPDEKTAKENLPVFTYKVTADVTDLNGETRSATTTVNVGYHAIIANIIAPNLIDKATKEQTLRIETKNLNGEFAPATGFLKIYKLQAPEFVLRPRPWQAPDYKTLSKTEFKTLFPHEAYDQESEPQNWSKGELVLSSSFNTEVEKTIVLEDLKKWDSGKYVAVLESQDKFGQDLKDEVQFIVFSDRDDALADNELFQIKTNQPSYQIDDVAEITLSTAAEELVVTLTTERNQNVTYTQIITLKNNSKTLKFPINKDDLGGFVIHYSYAFANSFNSGKLVINVPYPTSKLDIETLTFRDKLQPGTDETWSFKITGDDKDKASAELLASMYDASLDQFKTHSWNFNPHQPNAYRSYFNTTSHLSFGIDNFRIHQDYRNYYSTITQQFDQLNWFGLSLNENFVYKTQKAMVFNEMVESESLEDSSNLNVVQSLSGKVSGLQVNTPNDSQVVLRGNRSISNGNESLIVVDGKIVTNAFLNSLDSNIISSTTVLKGAEGTALYGSQAANGVIIVTTISSASKMDQIKVRKNLQETAFFFPKLSTYEAGEISFSFTTPEALTKWNLNLLAHNKKGEFDQKTLTAVTQKELMVIPNAPRFLREGDQIVLSAKIANLTANRIGGQAKLVLSNPITGEDISSSLITEPFEYQRKGQKYNPTLIFSVEAKENTEVSWILSIPEGIGAIQYKVLASAGNFSDGEQNVLPVLSNRMPVTETLPMHVKTGETKTFVLDKLKTNQSKTLKNHKLSLEITSNPAWYAVQALPYLMEFPYECNEQTFSRYYANALATHITNSNPKIQAVFNQWKTSDALVSNLEKNSELKSILIQETPWLRDAQSETEQKKRIALLFDLSKMQQELKASLYKLKTNQMSSGAWSWFGDYRENRYITQHILTGFGHLKKLNVASGQESEEDMITNALSYLDNEFVEEYNNLSHYNAKVDLSKNHLSMTQLHYLYMRSFYPEVKWSKEVEKIKDYYLNQIKTYWLTKPLYAKGLMALISFRNEDQNTSSKILKSLKETSITSDELGMYWKENTNSYYWYQAPIETQSVLIEAFSEIKNDINTIDNLKIWLLKHKQTNQWSTTKSTTDAIYAILLQGSDWLSVNESVSVLIGNQPISKEKLETVKVEAGTGYFKTTWDANEIKPDLAEITLTKKDKGIAFGSLYWQYFEDLDAITPAETPLKLKKKLFKVENTKTGEVLTEIKEDEAKRIYGLPSDQLLKVGDLIRVRIELRSDRPMEFVHLKDMRAAGLEPVNVISSYKYQDGLGYYESTKDASTNFFFDVLPKGIYVFEYDLRVNNAGVMSNGISTIQSMYAPEFSSHSKGIRLSVDTL